MGTILQELFILFLAAFGTAQYLTQIWDRRLKNTKEKLDNFDNTFLSDRNTYPWSEQNISFQIVFNYYSELSNIFTDIKSLNSRAPRAVEVLYFLVVVVVWYSFTAVFGLIANQSCLTWEVTHKFAELARILNVEAFELTLEACKKIKYHNYPADIFTRLSFYGSIGLVIGVLLSTMYYGIVLPELRNRIRTLERAVNNLDGQILDHLLRSVKMMTQKKFDEKQEEKLKIFVENEIAKVSIEKLSGFEDTGSWLRLRHRLCSLLHCGRF